MLQLRHAALVSSGVVLAEIVVIRSAMVFDQGGGVKCKSEETWRSMLTGFPSLLLRCSAIRQVPSSQTLHHADLRSSALLFKTPYRPFSSQSSIVVCTLSAWPNLAPIFLTIAFFGNPNNYHKSAINTL